MAGMGLLIGVTTARMLGPEGRGQYALAGFVTMAMAAVVGGLQASAAYDLAHRHRRAAAVKRTALLTSNALSLVFAVGSLLLFRFAGIGLPGWLLAGLTAQFAVSALTSVSGVFLGTEAVATFNRVMALPVAVSLAIFAALVLVHNHDVVVYLAAWTVAQYVGLAYGLWQLHRVDVTRGELEQPRRFASLVSFSFFASLVTVASLFNLRIDAWVLALFRGSTALGVYSTALQLAESLGLFSAALSIAVYARIGSLSAPESAALTSRAMRHLILILSLGAIVLFVGGDQIVAILFGPGFAAAGAALRVLLFGMVLAGVVGVLTTYFTNQAGRPQITLALTLTGALFNTAISLWLVPLFGILGAAAASSISYGIQGAAGLYLFQRASQLTLRSMTVIYAQDLADYARLARAIAMLITRK